MIDTMNLNLTISLQPKSSHKTWNPSFIYTCVVSGKGSKFFFIICDENFTIFQENTVNPFIERLNISTTQSDIPKREVTKYFRIPTREKRKKVHCLKSFVSTGKISYLQNCLIQFNSLHKCYMFLINNKYAV